MDGDAGDEAGGGQAGDAEGRADVVEAETVDGPLAGTPDPEPAEGVDDVDLLPEPAPDLSPRVAELEAERDRLAEERDSLTAALAAAGEELTRELERLATALAAVEAARDEALDTASAALADRDALSAQWADAQVDQAIRKALEKHTFIGVTPELRERACRNFISQIHADVEAFRDASGAWRTRVKGGGSVAAFVAAAVDSHAYLFTRTRGPGIGAGGGHIPPGNSGGGSHFGGPPPARFPAG